MRVALVVFVLAWIFGPHALRSAVPILLVFLIALGLELNFLVSALRSTPSPRPDRRPQVVERDRYGYDHETDDLVLIRRGDEEVWVAYSGESAEATVAASTWIRVALAFPSAAARAAGARELSPPARR